MAQKITVGLSTYLEDFTNGQVGFRVPPYTQYSVDMDTNFVTLRNTINQVIDELNAVQGPSATLGIDAQVFNDPARAGGPLFDGIIGLHSFLTTIGAPTSQLDVQQGDAVISSLKVSNTGGATLVGSGGAGTRWVAIDVNGTIFLETAAGQRALDIYTAAWDGAMFTSVTLIAETFFDGDEYEGMRDRPASPGTPVSFPALKFDQFNQRMLAVERMLAGQTTDGLGNALGQPAIRAGSAGTPGLAVAGDPNTGAFQPSADQFALAAAGAAILTVTATSVVLAQAALGIDGTESTPAWSFLSDPNTGTYRPGTDQWAVATGGTRAASISDRQQWEYPNQARVSGSTALQSIPGSTNTLIDFDEPDDWDLPDGDWHDHTSGTLSDRQEFTVPAGCGGGYILSVTFAWETVGANNRVRRVQILLNGSPVGDGVELTSQGPFDDDLTRFAELNAGDVITVRVFHTNGSNLDIDVVLQLWKAW